MKNETRIDSWCRQSGVIALRWRSGTLRVLLVTTGGGKRWVIPKGDVEEGLSAWRSAAKEAWEEAGVTGEVSRRLIGRYAYEKWKGCCTVLIYRLDVETIHDSWPEGHLRRRKWFSPRAAAERVKDPVLAQVIQDAARARARRAASRRAAR